MSVTGRACLVAHAPDMLHVNALVGINSDLAHAVLFTYAHALVFRYVSPPATCPSPSPPPTAVVLLTLLALWSEHAQYRHAGSTHAQPMLASVATHSCPSLCALHAKLSPPEAHAPSPKEHTISYHSLSTGYTDNYLLIILAPLWGGPKVWAQHAPPLLWGPILPQLC